MQMYSFEHQRLKLYMAIQLDILIRALRYFFYISIF